MTDWHRVQISEVCDLIVDCVNKTAPKVEYETEYKMLRTTNVRHGRVDTLNCKYVTENVFKKWTRRADLRRRDILLTREAPIGEVGMIKSDEKLFLGQRLMQYRANQNKIDPYFLLYSFLSRDLQHQFQMHEGTGSVVSHIRVGDCFKFQINVPPLPEQKAIAHILGKLDDKIELNRQMNQTLEAMAQALFKSWFVDFDPVMDNVFASGTEIPEALKAKAEKRLEKLRDLKHTQNSPPDSGGARGGQKTNPELAKLFPSAFEFNEALGKWIPEGWEDTTFGNEYDFLNGNAFKSRELLKDNDGDNYHVFKMGNIKRGGGFNFQGTKSFYPKYDLGKLEKYLLKKGDVLMAMTDMKSNMALLAHTALMPLDDVFLLNQRVGCLRAKPESHLDYSYLYLFSNHIETIDDLRSRSNSGVQVNLSTSEIKDTGLLLPPRSIHTVFNNQVKSYYEKMFKLDDEIKNLTKLRDTLLPQLISGKVRVPEETVEKIN